MLMAAKISLMISKLSSNKFSTTINRFNQKSIDEIPATRARVEAPPIRPSKADLSTLISSIHFLLPMAGLL